LSGAKVTSSQNNNELEINRRITRAYINTRPEVLRLIPHREVPDGTGGTKRTALPPRRPQRFRFIETGASFQIGVRNSETGENRIENQTLLGCSDVEIEVGDEFQWNGDTWRVVEVMFPNGYETRATVTRNGL
jgi:hypothetical protein